MNKIILEGSVWLGVRVPVGMPASRASVWLTCWCHLGSRVLLMHTGEPVAWTLESLPPMCEFSAEFILSS